MGGGLTARPLGGYMYNELPATIFIAIGTIVAAGITAVISYVNLVISKDQNVSNHRQKWIDAIRNNISEFIGLVAHYSNAFAQIEILEDINEKNKLADKLITQSPEIAKLYNRIILRLNPDDDKNIIKIMEEIEIILAGDSEKSKSDIDYVGELTKKLRIESKKLLREEWKRVKKGESSFVITKWIFIIGMFLILIFCYVLYDNNKDNLKFEQKNNVDSLKNISTILE